MDPAGSAGRTVAQSGAGAASGAGSAARGFPPRAIESRFEISQKISEWGQPAEKVRQDFFGGLFRFAGAIDKRSGTGYDRKQMGFLLNWPEPGRGSPAERPPPRREAGASAPGGDSASRPARRITANL